MINCAPEVTPLPIYLHEDFIQVPFPMTGLHSTYSSLFDLVCKLGAKPVPPVPDGFIAYEYVAFIQEVFPISQ